MDPNIVKKFEVEYNKSLQEAEDAESRLNLAITFRRYKHYASEVEIDSLRATFREKGQVNGLSMNRDNLVVGYCANRVSTLASIEFESMVAELTEKVNLTRKARDAAAQMWEFVDLSKRWKFSFTEEEMCTLRDAWVEFVRTNTGHTLDRTTFLVGFNARVSQKE